jgi:hypothetical protein
MPQKLNNYDTLRMTGGYTMVDCSAPQEQINSTAIMRATTHRHWKLAESIYKCVIRPTAQLHHSDDIRRPCLRKRHAFPLCATTASVVAVCYSTRHSPEGYQ